MLHSLLPLLDRDPTAAIAAPTQEAGTPSARGPVMEIGVGRILTLRV